MRAWLRREPLSGVKAEGVLPLSSYLPFWQKIDAAEQAKLTASAQKRTFHKGQTVSGGNECTGLFVVCSGQLRAFILSETGKEVTLYRLLSRDICLMSASCMLHSLQFDIQIEALEETVVYQIPTDIYKSLMETNAAVANYTNELMASRFSEVLWLVDQVLNHDTFESVTWLGIIASVICVIPLVFYDLSEKKHADYIRALKVRAAVQNYQNAVLTAEDIDNVQSICDYAKEENNEFLLKELAGYDCLEALLQSDVKQQA